MVSADRIRATALRLAPGAAEQLAPEPGQRPARLLLGRTPNCWHCCPCLSGREGNFSPRISGQGWAPRTDVTKACRPAAQGCVPTACTAGHPRRPVWVLGSRPGLGQHPVLLSYCCDGLTQHVYPPGTRDWVSLGPVTVSAGLVPPEVSKGESTARVFLACRGRCAPCLVALHSICSARHGCCGPTLPPPCQALGAVSRVPRNRGGPRLRTARLPRPPTLLLSSAQALCV